MRTILAWLLFTASVTAQTYVGSTASTLGSLTVTVKTEEPTAFIVQYQTTEKCFECGFRYAIGCSPTQADCGVPDKQVTHFEEFPDIKAALGFINRMWSGIAGSAQHAPSALTALAVRLWSVKTVELAEHKTTKEEPQPPKITVETKWSVKGSQ